MSFRQILASLTTAPAARFGAVHGGRIAAGAVADLTIFDDNDFANVRYTISGRHSLM